jgi:preprotein translocase subunit SecE
VRALPRPRRPLLNPVDPRNDPQPGVEPPSGADPPTSPPASPEPAAASGGDPAPRGGFLADTVEELRRVVWPSRQQLFGESVAVILMVTLSAFAIAAIDRFYSWSNGQVFR